MSSSSTQREVKVAVAGATGTVGQRFICLLSAHPYFRLVSLNASPRSAGKPYKDVVRWKQSVPIPKNVLDMVVKTCDVDQFGDAEIVFSGLDSDVAGDVGAFLLSSYLPYFVADPNGMQRRPSGKPSTPSFPTPATSAATRSSRSVSRL